MRINLKDNASCRCAVTIGSFDGVHKGHQYVIRQLAGMAHSRQLAAVAVTFANHPLQILRQGEPLLTLTDREEKEQRLKAAGADEVVFLSFTEEMAAMDARTFMSTFLRDRLNAEVLLMGYDNHIGHDRLCFGECVAAGKELGIEVVGCDEWEAGRGVSSTSIRHCIAAGDIEGANERLGYEYSLAGKVVAGFQNGRKMGFPTANIEMASHKVMPASGVYAVRVWIEGEEDKRRGGMLNIGTRPTLHNGERISIEVHIFDYSGNLYDKLLSVAFISRLREEREYGTVEELKEQLAKDEARCRRILEDEGRTEKDVVVSASEAKGDSF